MRRQVPVPDAPAEVAGRIRAARLQGRPGWLWPEVAVRDWYRALHTIEAATRALLLDRRPEPLRTADDSSLRALGLACYTSGMGPWLAWHVEAGRLDADDASSRLLGEHLAHSRSRWARLDRELHAVLTALAAVGVEPIILKGAYGARRWFPEPALRPVSDIDLLVPRASMAAAAAALRAAGYREKAEVRIIEPPHSVWRRHGEPEAPHSLMLVHTHDPIDVDLQGSLAVDFYVQTVPFEAPAADLTTRFEVKGASARALMQPLLAAHHAVHASHGNGLTLIRLVELALMLRHDMRTDADWSALDDLLHRVRARRFSWPAFALTEQLAPGTVPPTFLDRWRSDVPSRLRAVVADMTPATAIRPLDVSLRDRFMWARGAREHVRRLAVMLVPTARSGNLRQLGRIYAGRAFQLLRGRVHWTPLLEDPDRSG